MQQDAQSDAEFDVFLSHSSRDKDIVRALALRMRADGLRVWFDEWEIEVGDSIPLKIEEGLAQSKFLVLCMSAHSSLSDWTQLERQTVRFDDPLKRNRRLIPLRLDDAAIPGSLAQFAYVDWRTPTDVEYHRLLNACGFERHGYLRRMVDLEVVEAALGIKTLPDTLAPLHAMRNISAGNPLPGCAIFTSHGRQNRFIRQRLTNFHRGIIVMKTMPV